MRIAIFTDTYVPEVNGVAKTFKRFTDYLITENIEFNVFAPKSTNGNLFSNRVYSVKSFPFFLYPECRVALLNIIQLYNQVRAFNPDLIHVTTHSIWD